MELRSHQDDDDDDDDEKEEEQQEEDIMAFATARKNDDGTITLINLELDEDADGLAAFEDASSQVKNHKSAKNGSGDYVLRRYLFKALQDLPSRNKTQDKRDVAKKKTEDDTKTAVAAIDDKDTPSASETEDLMSSSVVPEYRPNSTDRFADSKSMEYQEMEREKEEAIKVQKACREKRDKSRSKSAAGNDSQVTVAEEGALVAQPEVRSI